MFELFWIFPSLLHQQHRDRHCGNHWHLGGNLSHPPIVSNLHINSRINPSLMRHLSLASLVSYDHGGSGTQPTQKVAIRRYEIGSVHL